MDPAIKAFESAIPYVDVKYRKNIIIFFKLMEMRRLIDACATDDAPKSPNWKLDMLRAIAPHLEDEKKAMLENVLKLMEMKDLIKTMTEMGL